jgi:protein TonB
MRALIVDHDPAVLESATRMLAGLLETVTATSKGECLAHLRAGDIGVIVACERLADGSGLDLLARVSRSHPEPLRILAADLERVKMLGAHLTPFELFDTIAYPIESLQLKSVIALAIAARGDAASGEYENVVMGSDPPVPPDADDTPFASSPPPAQPSLVLLTRDTSSLDAANAALAGKPYHLIAAREADEALTDIAARKPVVALIDCGFLGEDPAGWFGRARAASPETLLLALGRRDDGQRLEPVVANGTVGRFVSKPVTAAGVRLVLDSALRQQALAAANAAPAASQGASHNAVHDGTADPLPGRIAGMTAPDDDRELRIASAITSWESTDAASSAYALEPLPDNAVLRSLARPRTALLLATLGIVIAVGSMLLSGDDAGEATPAGVSGPPDPQGELQARTDALVTTLEDALTRDDLVAARRALDELSNANPAYPRLPLLTTLVTRAEETQRIARGAMAPANVVTPMRPVTTGASARSAPTPAPARSAGPAPARAANSADAVPVIAATPTVAPTTLRPGKVTPVSFSGRTLEESNRAVPVEATPPPPSARDTGPGPVVLEYKVLKRVSPDYPAEAHRRGIEGSVDVMFTVTSDGRAAEVRVVSSTPPGVFDREAKDAVRRWRFDPRYEDGVAVDSTAKVRLEFRLND